MIISSRLADGLFVNCSPIHDRTSRYRGNERTRLCFNLLKSFQLFWILYCLTNDTDVGEVRNRSCCFIAFLYWLHPLLWMWDLQEPVRAEVPHASTWPPNKDLIHRLLPSTGSPCLTLPTIPLEIRASHWQKECARPPWQPPPPRNSQPPRAQISTHWTHQVISWGLKYLLGKYLLWLSDPNITVQRRELNQLFSWLDKPWWHPRTTPRYKLVHILKVHSLLSFHGGRVFFFFVFLLNFNSCRHFNP